LAYLQHPGQFEGLHEYLEYCGHLAAGNAETGGGGGESVALLRPLPKDCTAKILALQDLQYVHFKTGSSLQFRG